MSQGTLELVLENGAREFEVDLADLVYDTPPLINYQRLVFLHPSGTELMGGEVNGLGEEKTSWGSPGVNLFATQEDKGLAPVVMTLGDGVWSGRGMNVLNDSQVVGGEHTLTWDEQTEFAATTGPFIYSLLFYALLSLTLYPLKPSSDPQPQRI